MGGIEELVGDAAKSLMAQAECDRAAKQLNGGARDSGPARNGKSDR